MKNKIEINTSNVLIFVFEFGSFALSDFVKRGYFVAILFVQHIPGESEKHGRLTSDILVKTSQFGFFQVSYCRRKVKLVVQI